MNASDVAYALNLDLEAINKRLHHPDGPHMQDIETLLYALHSLQYVADPPAAGRAYGRQLTPGTQETADAIARDLLAPLVTGRYSPSHDADTTQAIHDDHAQQRTPG